MSRLPKFDTSLWDSQDPSDIEDESYDDHLYGDE